MGISTNASIALGIDFDEENPLNKVLGEDFEELEEYLAYKDGISYPGGSDRTDNEVKEYYRRLKEISDDCPVELIQYCSYESPMYILAVRGTYTSARRGYPHNLKMGELEANEEKINAFKKWLSDHKITVDSNNPNWMLFSYWG